MSVMTKCQFPGDGTSFDFLQVSPELTGEKIKKHLKTLYHD